MRRLIPFAVAFALAGCGFGLPTVEQGLDPTVAAIQTQVAGMADAQAARPSSTPRPPRPTDLPLPTLPPQPTIDTAISDALADQERLLVELYRRASPAVVSIEVVAAALPDGHPPIPGVPGTSGQGSGFLFDDQGHIVTNNHVVEGAERLQVRWFDGTTSLADLIGTDVDSDLAVIKVRELPPGVAPLPLGESREVAVGQTAVAIGSPFGEQNTLTVGVVSGIGRTLRGPAREFGSFSIPNIIQTDAAINPGNSGGPLLNVRGEVIGVNTAIAVSLGGTDFEGVGYAVPSSTVARVAPALVSEGRYEHPWMGIGMWSLDALLAEQANLPVGSGVLITDVQPNSPAARAGLRAGETELQLNGFALRVGGDIVVAIDGQAVADGDQLIGLLDLNHEVGDTITLRVLRGPGGTPADVELLLEARP
jgi:2-alkenal reductase